MVQKIKVEGFQEFETVMNEIEKKKLTEVFVLFSGSKDSSGKSWCPDCVAGMFHSTFSLQIFPTFSFIFLFTLSAEPIVTKALDSALTEAVFVHVSVGDRAL